MTPEQQLHFRSTSDSRYPFEGKFLIREPDEATRGVSLWINDHPMNDLDPNLRPQRRFFEEDAEYGSGHMRLVPDNNIMGRDDYNVLLSGLHVPISPLSTDYEIEQTVYVLKPGHRVIVEQTRPDFPIHQQHRRIRRQLLPPEEDIQVEPDHVVRNYRELKQHLERTGVIFENDFRHWRGTTVRGGARRELATRINNPRI